MSDLIDGPVIAGPRYSTYQADDRTPAGSTVELDDVPGSRIPAERLDETDQWRAGEYRDDLLLGVYYLLSTRGAATTREIDDAVRTAAEAIRRVDRHCFPPPSAPVSLPVTDSHVRTYLDWLAGHGPALRTEGPQSVPAELHAACRRELVRRRLAYWGFTADSAERIALTAFGQAQVGAGAAAGVKLGEQDEAA